MLRRSTVDHGQARHSGKKLLLVALAAASNSALLLNGWRLTPRIGVTQPPDWLVLLLISAMVCLFYLVFAFFLAFAPDHVQRGRSSIRSVAVESFVAVVIFCAALAFLARKIP